MKLHQLIALKTTRFNTIADDVRTATNVERCFMHAARLVECMNDLEDLEILDVDGEYTNVFERVEATFEQILRGTPLLKNKLGMLCPKMVTAPVGITIFRVPLGTEPLPMPEAHNKVRGMHVQMYVTSSTSLREVFSFATDADFAPGILDFLDTLNRCPNERDMVLLELNGNDGTIKFGDVDNFQLFVHDQSAHPWMNYVGRRSLSAGTATHAPAMLRDYMVASERFSHMHTCFGQILFAPIGTACTGHWDTFTSECPPAPRKTRRVLSTDDA